MYNLLEIRQKNWRNLLPLSLKLTTANQSKRHSYAVSAHSLKTLCFGVRLCGNSMNKGVGTICLNQLVGF